MRRPWPARRNGWSSGGRGPRRHPYFGCSIPNSWIAPRDKHPAPLLMAGSASLPRAALAGATGGGVVPRPRVAFSRHEFFAESGVRRPLMPNPPGSFRAFSLAHRYPLISTWRVTKTGNHSTGFRITRSVELSHRDVRHLAHAETRRHRGRSRCAEAPLATLAQSVTVTTGGIDDAALVIADMLAKDIAADIEHVHGRPLIVAHQA